MTAAYSHAKLARTAKVTAIERLIGGDPPTEAEIIAAIGLDDDAFRRSVEAALTDDARDSEWVVFLCADIRPRTTSVLGALAHELGAAIQGRSIEAADERERTKEIRNQIGLRRRQAAWLKTRDHEDRQRRAKLFERRGMVGLALAIQRHRLDSRAAGIDPEPHDVDLWSVLDRVEVEYRDERITVAQALEYNIWSGDSSGR